MTKRQITIKVADAKLHSPAHVRPTSFKSSKSLLPISDVRLPSKPELPTRRSRFVSGLLLIVVSAGVGWLPFSPRFDLWLLISYGLLALVCRARSIYLLGPAILAVLLIPLRLYRGETGAADSYAIYAFLLLIFGTIAVLIEQRRDSTEH
jgi:hypothetical protein